MTIANGFPETLQQNEATYTYSPNGLRQTVTDANGNASYFHYEGHDRLQYWVMPSATATGYWDWANIEYYAYDANGNRHGRRSSNLQAAPRLLPHKGAPS